MRMLKAMHADQCRSGLIIKRHPCCATTYKASLDSVRHVQILHYVISKANILTLLQLSDLDLSHNAINGTLSAAWSTLNVSTNSSSLRIACMHVRQSVGTMQASETDVFLSLLCVAVGTAEVSQASPATHSKCRLCIFVVMSHFHIVSADAICSNDKSG